MPPNSTPTSILEYRNSSKFRQGSTEMTSTMPRPGFIWSGYANSVLRRSGLCDDASSLAELLARTLASSTLFVLPLT